MASDGDREPDLRELLERLQAVHSELRLIRDQSARLLAEQRDLADRFELARARAERLLQAGEEYASARLKPLGRPPIWKGCAEILAAAGGPLRAPDVLTRLHVAGWEFRGKHQVQTVRNVMLKKPEVFEKLPGGEFVLRNGAAGGGGRADSASMH